MMSMSFHNTHGNSLHHFSYFITDSQLMINFLKRPNDLIISGICPPPIHLINLALVLEFANLITPFTKLSSEGALTLFIV